MSSKRLNWFPISRFRTHSKASNGMFSCGKEASINRHRDPVDEGGARAQEEKNTLNHIINLCKPAQGNLGKHRPSFSRVGPAHLPHLGHGDSWVDCVYSDLMGTKLKSCHPENLIIP